MQIPIPVVSRLPVLDQDSFHTIPLLPPGKSVRRSPLFFDTEWVPEEGLAAASLLYACIEAGVWHAVPGNQFMKEITANPLIPAIMHRRVWNATWHLVTEGLIEVVHYQEMTHFIPTPRLVTIVCARNDMLAVHYNDLAHFIPTPGLIATACGDERYQAA